MNLDLKVGDVVLGGKFKNKRIVVKTIGKDDLGQPTINGRSMLNFRIEKNLPKDKQSKETREGSDTVKKEATTITKTQLRAMIQEAVNEQLRIKTRNPRRPSGPNDFKFNDITVEDFWRISEFVTGTTWGFKEYASALNSMDEPAKQKMLAIEANIAKLFEQADMLIDRYSQ